MPQGISLHFAVPTPGLDCCTTTTLSGSAGNARKMAELAQKAGFWVREPLIGDSVTREAVLSALAGSACELKPDDLLLITFAGHGCQRLDVSGHPELDGYDETWCLANGELIDDELHSALAKFAAGVRILIISESCHSGVLDTKDQRGQLHPATPEEIAAWEQYRHLVVADRVSRWNLDESFAEIVLPRRADRVDIQAQAILFAACQEREEARDMFPLSLFTSQLERVLATFATDGNHLRFIWAVRRQVAQMNEDQHPGMAIMGPPDAAFPAQRPFKI